MSNMLKLFLIFALICVINAKSLEPVHSKALFSLFDGMTCTTCEGVMNIVSKQIPDPKTLPGGELGATAIKLAIKGACAYYSLGVPPAMALCMSLTDHIATFIADDVLKRTKEFKPKSNCRAMGMCPPCKAVGNSKFVMVQKRPALALPWETHNKAQHVAMWKKFEAESEKERQAYNYKFQMHNHGIIPDSLNPAKYVANASCYACKSIMGIVGGKVTDVRGAGRNMIVTLVKQQCLSYVTGIPFTDRICETMAQQSVGRLADNIMGKGKILPGENCRSIDMCPPCTGKACEDEVDVEKGKTAKDTPIPDVDTECSEPPLTHGVACTDNYPAQCKQGNSTCETPVYERMMRMECMFTCVCRWLPKFSDLTSYLPGK